jgi:hypothetical protein
MVSSALSTSEADIDLCCLLTATSCALRLSVKRIFERYVEKTDIRCNWTRRGVLVVHFPSCSRTQHTKVVDEYCGAFD